MAFRIFIAFVVLACAYVVFETGRMFFMERSLYNVESSYLLGNPNGDLDVVMFFEYDCPRCRAYMPIVEDAIAQDGNVRFIPRPLSFLDPGGVNPVLLFYTAAKFGKAQDIHDALIKNYRVIDDTILQDLALETGIAIEDLQAGINDDDIHDLAEQNQKLAEGFRLPGTPAFGIGGEFLFTPPRDLSTSELLTLFNEAREQ